jgi:hypothetical protein
MTRILAWLVMWSGFLVVLPCGASTRHYYIAAEDVTWDYAPSGRDLLGGRPIPQPWAQRTQWPKTRYTEYTDLAFSVRKPQPEWLGILGPVIRAEVGDTIVVDFLNRSKRPHSIHPHGVRYDKASEGAFYLPWGAGAVVPQGVRFTYRWFADEGSGPAPGQLSSAVWWYHPHIDEPSETNAGLMGPIIITAKGKARANGSPKDVDREFVASFMIFDELGGRNEGQFHAINGYVFGNLPGLVMKQGEKVRWYSMGMGSERDIHTPHWHGKTVTDGKRNADVIELLPASTSAVDMLADNPGTWLFHCQVADHMEAGMTASFTIYRPSKRPCPLQFVSGEFWNTTDEYRLKVKNVSGKKIKSLGLVFEHFTAPQLLHHPFVDTWTFNQPIEPGHEQIMEMKGYGGGQNILGWVLLPSNIQFEDRTSWSPRERGECFGVYWKDQDHPDLKVIPPEQEEMKED